jgi:ABC-type multidrug transport system ATPase subunit
MAAVEIESLSKRYGKVQAVQDLSFAVAPGRVTGFLGPNGAGKSTTLRMLLGLVRPDAGSATFGGRRYEELAHPSAQVGAVLEDASFHPGRSGRDHLRVLAAAGGHPDARVDEVLGQVGIADAGGRRVKGYSMGMRQRLAIAAALLMPRELLVLDEPTNGLDPQGTREVRHLVASLASDGATVFVSSHLLSEVEQMCTHLGVMSDGRLVAQGSTSEVRGGTAPTARVLTRQPSVAARIMTELGLDDVQAVPGGVRGTPDGLAPETIVAALVEGGVGVKEFTVTSPSLEDLFVSLTGEGFDVSA